MAARWSTSYTTTTSPSYSNKSSPTSSTCASGSPDASKRPSAPPPDPARLPSHLVSHHSHAPAGHRPHRAPGDYGHNYQHDHDEHDAHRHDGHGHSHGLVDESIKRSRAGVRAVALALLVLGLTAAAQTAVFAISGSLALLADLIHNAGDAATAIPLGIAFALRSARAERWAGLAVVLAILISACVAGFEAVQRLIEPAEVTNLAALAAAGAIGVAGNWAAALIRTRAGRRLDSPALIADGAHARADAHVSLGVIASAAVVAVGLPVADPLIGLAITVVILRITYDSLRTVRGDEHHH